MEKEMTTPLGDGFYMPGEFEPHEGCILIWPKRPGSWPYGAKAARRAFTRVIEAIGESENVYVAAGASVIENARETLKHIPGVKVFPGETDDAWARDVAPTFLVNKKGERRCVNWEFNAWGGTYNGLYPSWEKDNAFGKLFAEWYGTKCYDAAPFVLEGGAIHSDGEGTVLATKQCLLSPGRNPSLSQNEIEEMLCRFLGAKKVIWIPRGIYGDETDEHVDNVCAFIKPGEVVLAWTENKDDPQYELSLAGLKALEQARDAKGRALKIHKLPIPDCPVRITGKDLEGFAFEPGEDVREAGERLAASYVNFYFSNGAVVLPGFGGENKKSDRRAVEIMEGLCPGRKVIQIPARDILVGGGNIHCITQQVPLV